jgi:hypothetical protein
MLERDPLKRATAEEILQHDWLREHGVASDEPIEMEVLMRIKKFSAAHAFKKEAIKVRVGWVRLASLPSCKESVQGEGGWASAWVM